MTQLGARVQIAACLAEPPEHLTPESRRPLNEHFLVHGCLELSEETTQANLEWIQARLARRLEGL